MMIYEVAKEKVDVFQSVLLILSDNGRQQYLWC